jgi:large repetitive protein
LIFCSFKAPQQLVKKIVSIAFFVLLLSYCKQVVAHSVFSFAAPTNFTFVVNDSINYTAPNGTSCLSPGGLLLSAPPNAAAGTTYQWTKDGTSISGAVNNTYTATETGSYRLNITLGGNTFTTNAVVISFKSAANFNFSPATQQCGNLPVSFTTLTTLSSHSYNWNFNDPNSGGNNTTTATNPTHAFVGTPGTASQTFNVSLRIRNSAGCDSTIVKPVIITQRPGSQLNGPSRTIYNGQTYFRQCTGAASANLTFANNSSTSASNTDYKIIWGDGSPDFTAANFISTTHTYAIGSYNLKFIVTANSGCIDTSNYFVFVGSNPSVGLGNPGNTTAVCSGGFLTFPITGTTSNTPGTIYIASFNDGSLPDTLIHPPPASITHQFAITSCGQNGDNSFTASLIAQNPCASSSVDVKPIRVSQKPISNFSIAPLDTVCVTRNVAFTISQSSNTYADGNVCQSGNKIWKITPSAGVTTSGLGNDFNSNDPSIWQDGNTAINAVFSNPGVYSIKLKSGNPVCGIDSITKQICVNPLPAANFTLSNNAICSNNTVTATNTSINPNCGVNIYTWSVTYSNADCTGNTSGFSFAGGTNANSVNPQFLFTNPGTYSIKLVVRTPGNSCNDSIVKTVTVKTVPTVPSIQGLNAICENGNIAPTVNAVNCYPTTPLTFAWSSGSGTITNASSANPTINYTTAGTYSVSVNVTNECGTTTTNGNITVNPRPVATVPANQIFCGNVSTGVLNFTSNIVGTTFTYTNNNTAIGLPSSGTGSSINFTTANVTTQQVATITVTPTVNGCSGPSQSFTITVNPTPVNPTVTSPINYCQNATASALTAGNTSGNNLLWYTVASGGTSSTTAPTPSTTTVGNTTFYVSQQNATTLCESGRAAIVVNVFAPVNITATQNNPTICGSSNGSIVINGLLNNTSGYTLNYTKNGIAVSTINFTSSASGSYTITNLNAAVYDNIVVSRNGCSSNSIGPLSLTDPNPPNTPTANVVASPICSGNSIELTASSTTPGVTYTWSGPNSFSSTQQNPTRNNATVTMSGTYSVIATLAGCTSGAASVNVVVNQTPQNVVAANNNPCSNTALNLTSSSTTSGVSFAWTGPNSFTSALQNPTINNAAITNNGTYTVTATLGSCSNTANTVVTVKPTPNISSIDSTNPTNCATSTGTITLNGLTANTLYSVSFSRNGNAPNTQNITANASGNIIISNLQQGTYTNISVTLNGCISNMVGPISLSDPNPPATPTISSNAPICSGNSLQLNASSTTAGVSYAWSSTNGFTSNQQNPVRNNATVNMSGTYTVTATLNSCTASNSIAIVVNATPTVPVITNNSPICEGGTINLTASSTAATSTAITYAWTGPNGFTSTLQNPSINNATPINAGTYNVIATGVTGNCSSTSANTNVVVNGVLVNTINNNPQTICSSQSVTVIGTAASGGNGTFSYQWQQSTNSGVSYTNIVGQTGISLTFTPTASVVVRRVVTSIPCISESASTVITVQPPIGNNTIQQNQSICINTAPALLIGSTPTGGNGLYNYQWEQSTNNGISWSVISGAITKDYQPSALASNTVYRRNVSTSLCIGPQNNVSNTISITVLPNAQAAYTFSTNISCAPFALHTVITPTLFNDRNNRYEWYANNNFIGAGVPMPNYSMVTPLDSVTIKLKTISTFGCLNDSVSYKFYTLPKPIANFTITDTVACGPITIGFTNTSLQNNLFGYTWNFGNGITSNLANPNPILFNINTITRFDTTYFITLKSFTSCDTSTITKTVRVKAKPQALFTPNKVVGCSPLTVTFSNNSKGVNMQFTWLFDDGSAPLQTNNTNAVQHTFITGIQDTFRVRLIATNDCGSDTTQFNIVVSPNRIRLDFAINGNEAFGCKPHTVRFINNSNGATGFTWNFGDGNTLNTTKNIDTVTHTFTTAGNYLVTLTATNGCSDTSDVERVQVFNSPNAAFVATPFSVCIGDTIRFTNSTDTATGYAWRFGDNTFSNLTNPIKQYTTAGNFTTTLIASLQHTSGLVCYDTAIANIVVTPTQQGNFIVSDSVSNCVPFTIQFTNTNLPSISTNWNFGNGATASGNSVSYTYNMVGNYTASMQAIHPNGCTYIATKPIVINGPSGTWTYDKGFVCGTKPVRFQVNATNTDTLIFNFGDGNSVTTTSRVVFHTYTLSGNYNPTVQLKSGNCFIRLQGIDTIKVDNLQTGFTFNQQKVCGNTTVAFTDTSRAFYNIAAWQWNFGDGSAANFLQNPLHSYTVSNNYPIQLIVTSNSGCKDTATLTIPVVVNAKPSATLTTDLLACTNNRVRFNANIVSIDSVNLTRWLFGNNTTAIGINANTIFAQAGNYSNRFIVGTINGCYDTVIINNTVSQSPTINASNDVTICQGQNTQLNVSGINVNNYAWQPNNSLNCGNCSSPTATPTTSTLYVVTGTANNGCTARDSVAVTVIPPLRIAVSPTDSICLGEQSSLRASGANTYSWFPATGLSANTGANVVANPTITTTYRIIGNDAFGCFADTAFTTVAVGGFPILNIGNDQVMAAGTTYTFTPTFTNGPIVNWRWQPARDLSCVNCPNPTATAKNDICYTATATNNFGCAATDTLCIKVFCQSTQVFIPNAFLPKNGTGNNEVLMVRGVGIKLVKSFRIFNRWGQVVFEKANFAANDKQYGWDGMIRGKMADVDVYVYTCEVVCENEVAFTYKGNIALLK